LSYSETWGDAIMIDIDSTFIIHLINFLVLLAVLHFILFKPIRQIMQEREQGISAALSDAKNAQKRMQDLTEQYTAFLAESKQKATALYNTLYQEGLDIQRDMIAAERSTAVELLDKARTEIGAASSAARDDLRKEAEKLSQEITIKLLGRAV
jgi:F-type H+-transporting ATPase subunit b